MTDLVTNDGSRANIFTHAIPQSTESENAHYGEVVKVVTAKYNKYLEICMKDPPFQVITDPNNKGATAQTRTIDGKKSFVLRPHEYRKKHPKATYVPSDRLAHEEAHIMENEFIGLPVDRKTDTAVYLSEGFAEYMSVADPSDLYSALGEQKPEQTDEWLRKEIKTGSVFSKELVTYFSLDKLFATNLHNSDVDDPTDTELAKILAPYKVGATLVKYIIDRGGLIGLKDIMKLVQVDQRYAYGWSSEDYLPTKEEYLAEEVRVRGLLKNAIQEKFGDVTQFEKNWKQAVLGNI